MQVKHCISVKMTRVRSKETNIAQLKQDAKQRNDELEVNDLMIPSPFEVMTLWSGFDRGKRVSASGGQQPVDTSHVKTQ